MPPLPKHLNFADDLEANLCNADDFASSPSIHSNFSAIPEMPSLESSFNSSLRAEPKRDVTLALEQNEEWVIEEVLNVNLQDHHLHNHQQHHQLQNHPQKQGKSDRI